MLTGLIVLLLFGGMLALGVYMYRWQQHRGEETLRAWAAREGLRLLESEPANSPGTGPMNRNAADKRIVYRIKVEDQTGRIRRGLVRVGQPGVGALSDSLSVEWDP